VPASLVWFRNDLRLADNPALIAGLGSGRPVVPVYVFDEETDGVRPAGRPHVGGCITAFMRWTPRCERSDRGLSCAAVRPSG
jgi:deoxyribodipyrimidine photolyase